MAKTNKLRAENFSNIFLLIIVIAVLYLCYLLFRPFLKEIVMSGVLVTIFYPVYLKVVYWTKGRITLSALIMCVAIGLLIIIPLAFLIVLIAFQIIELYPVFLSNISMFSVESINSRIISVFALEESIIEIQDAVLSIFQQVYVSLLDYARDFLTEVGLTFFRFFASFVLMIFTMFFLFRDGKSLLRRLMKLTPLSNKYDKLIWQKFSDVSYTAMVASLLTSAAQAFTGMLAFWFVGLPALFPAVLMFIASFLPYIGTAFVWLPLSIYLLAIGKIWQGVFLLFWGVAVISMIDEFLRPFLIKNKAKVHTLIIAFSIFGGIVLWGIWGIVFGPLAVALAVTLLHIYELEYANFLER